MAFETGDDAAIYRLDERVALVLTVDFFPPIVDNPFHYGEIAVANALSDVYAVGGRPITALNIVGFPRELDPGILAEVLSGGASKAREAGVSIVGGHTVDDREPKYGLAVTGIVEPGRHVPNAGAKHGDSLVLTKPIGTGVITTAGKADVASADVLAGAVRSMTELNRAASEAMLATGVNAATDITGYGLLGHLKTMLQSSSASATVSRASIPVLPGVLELLEQGVAPGGTHRNLESLDGFLSWEDGLSDNDRLLLCDAQTSGGLLVSVARDKRDDLIARLRDAGTLAADVIGEVTDGTPGHIHITR